jgi:transcriptional regulator with XRE-family HTH domain
MNKFGEKILSLRTEKNLSTKEVGQAVAIPQSRYSELEKWIRIPTEGQIQRIEKFYTVTEGELSSLIKTKSFFSVMIFPPLDKDVIKRHDMNHRQTISRINYPAAATLFFLATKPFRRTSVLSSGYVQSAI